MGRSILVAVDASEASQAVALWAAHNLARPGDSFHVVAIAPPIAYAMTPPAPIASAGAVREWKGGTGREVGWWGGRGCNSAVVLLRLARALGGSYRPQPGKSLQGAGETQQFRHWPSIHR